MIGKNMWENECFIAVDLETTGQFPIESEICEIGAVKWKNGEVIDSYSTLLKPSRPMSQEVIAIHNISNEMVAEAPLISEKLAEFDDFIKDGIVLAHHAPFDIGFLVIDYEKQKIPLPKKPIVCTSLLSRNVITESPNHRLQTLVQHLGIEGGKAHRALDDAKSCLEVGLECFKRLGDVNIKTIIEKQRKSIHWSYYSMEDIKSQIHLSEQVDACIEMAPAKIVYQGGSKPGKPRTVFPKGIVRNPNGDFLAASDQPKGQVKRFYLNRITESQKLGK